ncbi:MAG: protein kinase domain-containing protein [Bacteroidales bacterium]
MSLAPGTRLGPYEVAALLGAGGMGEVYRARDTHLNRDVALKVLLDSVASDPERLVRFKREAHLLASLNHPHIAHLYGFEAGPQTSFLVMELVEGPTLADLIAAAPRGLPLEQVLPIARQIAEAIEAAHEQGVIHRDLKPANVKVRDDGVVKVLDFGLAKAIDPTSSSSAEALNSPTLTARATQLGVILGTAAYMAPEQAKGRAIDKRADVWAFGAVLYEMLTGERAFKGEDVSDTLASVLRQDIALTALPATTPPRLTRLIGRCLERDPKQRLRDIGEARIELARLETGAADIGAAPTPAAASAPRWRRALPWATAGVAGAALVAVLGLWAPWRTPPVLFETRLEVATPATSDLASFAISPDGRRLVSVGADANGPSKLWLRQLDQTTAQPLEGTEGAAYPFWSPDSRSVAFFVGPELKKLNIGSGLPQSLLSAQDSGRGGSWNADGVIVFGLAAGPLRRVPSTGGTPATVTALAPGQTSHRFPHFLPGGRQLLFYAAGASAGVYLGSLDSPASRRIATADTSAQLLPPNWLLFQRQGALFAQRADLARAEPTSELMPVADQLAFNQAVSAAAFSVSPAGSIAYRTGSANATRLTWFDRSGKAVGTIGEPDTSRLMQPMLSPDGRRVVAFRTVQNNQDLWVFESERMTRWTFDPGRDMFPVWSPDGSGIAFAKDSPKGPLCLYQSSGPGREELLLSTPTNNIDPNSWSPDNRFLIYGERGPDTGGDLWVLPLDGQQKPYPFVNSRFEERTAQFSPNGRWVAYASNESGQSEIYVRPFPPSRGQWLVSTMGGVTPRWRPDGTELYYISPNGSLTAVKVVTESATFQRDTPVALFPTRIVGGGTATVGVMWQYDVARDGRFLINVTTGGDATTPITVIQNWTPRK